MNAPHNAIALIEGAISPQQVMAQVQLIQQVLREVMVKDTHYGTVPGCGDKVVLLKPGAEKLCFTFQLVPTFEIFEREITGAGLPAGHREYRITCRISNRAGILVCEGVGIASTMEKKYRYRGEAAESTGRSLPREYWDLKKSNSKADQARATDMIGGKGFTARKTDEGWFIFQVTGEKSENPDIADTYNTVLKIAKKRAHVDAAITATAASDLFTQDIDEDYDFTPAKTEVEGKPAGKAPEQRDAASPAPKTAATPATATTPGPSSTSVASTPSESSAPAQIQAGVTHIKAEAEALFTKLAPHGEKVARAIWKIAKDWQDRHTLLTAAWEGVDQGLKALGEQKCYALCDHILKQNGWPTDDAQKIRAIAHDLAAIKSGPSVPVEA